MLLYEYKVRDELDQIRKYAENLRAKFEAEATPSDLLRDAENLEILFKKLMETLPHGVGQRSEFRRHLHFLLKNLREDSPGLCKDDIDRICDDDLKVIEDAFRIWITSSVHVDEVLRDSVSDLMIRQEFDSAIRKAFVLLKQRICERFHVTPEMDGKNLANHVFGKSCASSRGLSKSECDAYRNLLAGLFSVFRNRHAHDNKAPSFAEADGVISMINQLLIEIEGIAERAKKHHGR